ncbi:MAG: hypothetical protein AAGD38_20490 [Acidobacteriota bacterium]
MLHRRSPIRSIWSRRIWVALVGLWAVISLEVVALPASTWQPKVTVCVMSCATDGGDCCCMLTARRDVRELEGEHILARHPGCADAESAVVAVGKEHEALSTGPGQLLPNRRPDPARHLFTAPPLCSVLLSLHGPRAPPRATLV